MNSIKDRISGKKGRQISEDDIPEIHHQFMCVYGWIPLEEFKELPIKNLYSLLPMVQKRYNNFEILRIAILKFCGVKDPK